MTPQNIIATDDRRVWRQWLQDHFETEAEAWFVFPLLAAGESSLSYNDAVEEALCFGWIDGLNRHLDALHCIRRFTPRRPGSTYSRINVERLIWLDAHGMVHPSVQQTVREVIRQPFLFPADILDALRADAAAWEHYNAFSPSYRRIRVAYIDAARQRPEEFRKRLESFVAKCRQNRLIVGYGGIGKYYQ